MRNQISSSNQLWFHTHKFAFRCATCHFYLSHPSLIQQTSQHTQKEKLFQHKYLREDVQQLPSDSLRKRLRDHRWGVEDTHIQSSITTTGYSFDECCGAWWHEWMSVTCDVIMRVTWEYVSGEWINDNNKIPTRDKSNETHTLKWQRHLNKQM